MQLTSASFQDQQMIPRRYSGEGEDVSPELRWSDVPASCQSFALICEDPDSPRVPGRDHPFVHWLIYNLSANTSFLPEGLAKQGTITSAPVDANQGTNSFGKLGYGGPMPPVGHGTHHYHFTLYALDRELSLAPGITQHDLLKAMEGHVLEEVKLIGKYERLETSIHKKPHTAQENENRE
jgi:Raf kinase inhibitor-like YbhB/YbcL family protein